MSGWLELVPTVRTVTLRRPTAASVQAALAASSGLVVLRLGGPFDDEAEACAAVEALQVGAGAEAPRAVLSLGRGTAHFDLLRARAALARAPQLPLALDPRDLLLGYALPFAGVDAVFDAVAPLLPQVRVFHYGYATSEHGNVPIEVFQRVPRGIPDVLVRVGRSLCERLFDETARARRDAGAQLTVEFDVAGSPRLAGAITARAGA